MISENPTIKLHRSRRHDRSPIVGDHPKIDSKALSRERMSRCNATRARSNEEHDCDRGGSGIDGCGVPRRFASRSDNVPRSCRATRSRQLSAAELRQRYAAGVTSYSSGSSGPKTFAGYYSPDGKIVLHSPQMNDIGTYRITDDGQFCTRYTTIRNGVETCQTMWQVDQNTIEGHLPNGAVIQATSVPGNPEGF